MDKYPVSSHLVGLFFQVDGKQLGQQYKDHLSDYGSWEQKEHAEEWMLFPANAGSSLSIITQVQYFTLDKKGWLKNKIGYVLLNILAFYIFVLCQRI